MFFISIFIIMTMPLLSSMAWAGRDIDILKYEKALDEMLYDFYPRETMTVRTGSKNTIIV